MGAVAGFAGKGTVAGFVVNEIAGCAVVWVVDCVVEGAVVGVTSAPVGPGTSRAG